MSPAFFFKGALIGFSIAAPVGPIGVLCIRRSLANGMRAGFSVGLGAATADAVYGSVAGFGLTAVSDFLTGQKFWLGLIGGLFLCYLGVRTFFSQPAEQEAAVRSGGLVRAWFSTFLLTLTNPATILSFAAVFAGFGLAASPDYPAAALLVLGVFMGSACWWFLLSGGVGLFRSRLNSGWMRTVNRISGVVIILFGIAALLMLRK